MRKIFFLVFILFLFIFSATNAHATTNLCKVAITILPGDHDTLVHADVQKGVQTIDNHTHKVNMSISSDPPLSAKYHYWVKFIAPPNAVILQNDLDDQLYNYGRFQYGHSRDGEMVGTVDDFEPGNQHWEFQQKILPVSCDSNGANCSIQLNQVSGSGILGDDPSINLPGFSANQIAPAVFLEGTYGVEVIDADGADHQTLCNGSFNVSDTLDYGYNNCQVILANEADTMKMEINTPIKMDGLVWTDPTSPEIHFGPVNGGAGIRATFEINNPSTGKEARRQGQLYVNSANHSVEHTFDPGVSAIGGYNFTIRYGGGALGANEDREACRRGPLLMADVGQPGGHVNGKGNTPCFVCKANTSLATMDNKNQPVCYLSDGSSKDQQSVDEILCPANTICSHMETASATPSTDGVTTGCIPVAGCSGTDSSSNCYGGGPQDQLCSSPLNPRDVGCASINTGLGVSLPTTPGGFVSALLGIVLSIAGGISIVLIMISGYKMMVSQGEPEKIKDAKEQLTAAIIGLLFIIFSLVILQIIGVNILNLPGFGK